jgi:hypothetical protein
VNVGLLATPVHDDVTPLIVTLVEPGCGDKLPDAVMPEPVAEY